MSQISGILSSPNGRSRLKFNWDSCRADFFRVKLTRLLQVNRWKALWEVPTRIGIFAFFASRASNLFGKTWIIASDCIASKRSVGVIFRSCSSEINSSMRGKLAIICRVYSFPRKINTAVGKRFFNQAHMGRVNATSPILSVLETIILFITAFLIVVSAHCI